ncbi:MAG: hypothetical protein ACO1QS_21195 [Verrucomicrobiota bacterium]
MKTSQWFIALTAVFASIQVASAADVVGKVTVTGTPSPEKPLPLDPGCGALHKGAKPTTTFFVVGPNKELADVFVYVTKGLEGKTFTPPANNAVLDQVGCVYVPYVVGAQTGQKIEVRNSDPLLHNVHPTPAVAGNKEVNKAQLAKSPPLMFSWDKPEVFLRFKCDVHPWMFSYVGLVDHPFFAVTGKDGTFKLANLPDGKYTVEAYHRKGGKVTKDIEVKGGNVTANFEITAQ